MCLAQGLNHQLLINLFTQLKRFNYSKQEVIKNCLLFCYTFFMKIFNSLQYLILFSSSIFVISTRFASPPAPTLYISAGGCCALAIMAIVLKYKQQILSVSTTELLLGVFLLFTSIYGAYSGSIDTEWIITGSSLLLTYVVTKRSALNIGWFFIGLVCIGIAQAVYGLGQYMHWAHNIAAPNFRMSGNLDNPAGFAATLSVCFPFALFLLLKKGLYWKITGALAALLFVVAIILSQSRAGVIAILVISGIWVVKALNPTWMWSWSNRTKIVSSAALIITILVGLYFLKKDSADGRLLIWQCSGQMIADKPLLGHGTGGFQREYMLYQADYFRAHPASSYVMRADIVKHPFNELVLLLVEHGLLGGLLFGLLIYLLIREYKKNKQPETFYAMLCLSGIAVFACFSYPLGYPFIKLMAVFCAAAIMRQESKVWEIPKGLFSVVKPAALVMATVLLVFTGKMFYDEYDWNTIAKRSLAGETKEVMPDYARLYKTMNRNGLFLYNYGAELNYINKWNKSVVLLTECANFYNDIDLQLLLADNYMQLKQYAKAEKCFLLAHQMIPNRFIPLYRLALLYKNEGKIHEARRIAEILVKKKVKVESIDILTIKDEMNQLIQGT
jgi:O-antigen polymerase